MHLNKTNKIKEPILQYQSQTFTNKSLKNSNNNPNLIESEGLQGAAPAMPIM